MSEHDVAYNPIHYMVWYESLAGINPKLTQAIAEYRGNSNKLDEETVQFLHGKYIEDRDNPNATKMREALIALIGKVHEVSLEASSNTDSFTSSLERYERQIPNIADSNDLHSIIFSLLEDTQNIRAYLSDLQVKLKERVTEVEALRHSLNNALTQTIIDPLTGLLNRRGFSQSMIEQTSQADYWLLEHPYLIMVDIDFFKKINDSFGHLSGDNVIIKVADTLLQVIKDHGTVARIGGEEFAIILNPTRQETALALAEELRATIENTAFQSAENHTTISATISLGISVILQGETSEAVITRADSALYQSKNSGRNRVTVFQYLPSTTL